MTGADRPLHRTSATSFQARAACRSPRPCGPILKSKGGVEATARLVRRDLVPTRSTSEGREASKSFADLEQACAMLGALVNQPPHHQQR